MLLRGIDLRKDQSLFFIPFKPITIKKILFPLDKFTKEEVKEIAKQAGLNEFANKKKAKILSKIRN